jgi:type IV secretory pathway protease TraF
MVIALTPEPFRSLADRRGYVPARVPLVKREAASRGDRICTRGQFITINGRAAALRLRTDARGRPLPWWDGCRPLLRGEILLLGDSPGSFDGRYFGPMPRQDVLGKAVRL